MAGRREKGLGRREFLVTGAATAAALATGPLGSAAPAGPKVVIVRDKSRQVIKGEKVNAEIARRLVDKAVATLAGTDDIGKAWAKFVGPNDKVAVKFNGLFDRASTHPEVVKAVADGLLKAGVKPGNIVIYDRDERAFRTARIPTNRDKTTPLAYPTNKDYGPKVKAGPHDTQITNILHRADVLINLPMMKTHVLAGMSGALKNHLGTVPNASRLHRDERGGKSCLYVADLNALEPIKAKTRICICDALYGLYDAGPQYRGGRFRWDYHGVVASTDPVALDIVLSELIKAKRLEKGLSPYCKPIRHVLRAAELGLGEADLAKINRHEIEI